LSIEHLASQAGGGVSVHNIGNLLAVPVKFNGEVLGSKPFLEKKQLLIDGGYSLEDDIKAAQDWQTAQIDKRTDDLAAYAYDTVWSIK
jgi:hypothetical protein